MQSRATVLLAVLSTAVLLVPGVAPACVEAETESNDTVAAADGPICSGRTVDGDIGRRDVDWFSFDAAAGGTVAISLDHHRRDDFDWILYDAGGAELGAGMTSALPESGQVSIATAGRYFLLVEPYRGRGWYTLDVTFPDGGGQDPGCDLGPRPAKPGGLQTWLTGSPDDLCVEELTGPGLLAMGGNYDIDEAFVQRAGPIVAGGDVVVLRTSGSDGYNDYLYDLLGADSVETLLVDRRDRADSDYVAWVVESAEMVWIAGGDQSEYLNAWAGTRVETAIRAVWTRGGVVGGISAGEAVLGEFIYDPDGIYSVYSEEAVTDPCHPYVNLSTDFLELPETSAMIFDSHFAQRDRMGRLLTFMARIAAPGIAPGAGPVTGIGIDEDTSLFIGPDGAGVVDGDNAVYVLVEDSQTSRDQVECGAAVIYTDVLRYALRVGDTYDFTTGASSVAPIRVDVDGRDQSFYSPRNPY